MMFVFFYKFFELLRFDSSCFYFNEQVTGKALMLDEIINYVQCLQNQVEVMSLKYGLDPQGLSVIFFLLLCICILMNLFVF